MYNRIRPLLFATVIATSALGNSATTTATTSAQAETTKTAASPAVTPKPTSTPEPTPPPTKPTLSFGTGYGQDEWLTSGSKQTDFAEPENLEHFPVKPYDEFKKVAADRPSPQYRPVGAMTDKVAYVMAGHGWTYGEERMAYSTQRGLGFGMVEDLGNADQMHIFAHMVWNCGATVVPMRPIDHQPHERIVDTAVPQTSTFGTWYKGTSDRFYGDDRFQPRYLVSIAELEETAVAQFRPYIPEAGYYPVYTWARAGTDRVNQTYRIFHSGGASEVEVDHRKVGNAWIWLGSYFFEKGMDGYVEVSNSVRDPYTADGKHYVVADAIRFGNGQGDIPRPGGVSGRNREDEGDIYWIEDSLGNGADPRFYGSRLDRNATISAPPRTAGLLNLERYDDFFDRILISFHSNASTGKSRGAIGLYNKDEQQRPQYQQLLAEKIGDEINRVMKERSPFGDYEWPTRERGTYAGINFGELRRDYLQNEMSATIVETAFHDNKEDAEIMRVGSARILLAQATLAGLFDWFAQVDPSFGLSQLPPDPPQALAIRIESDRKASLTWLPGESGENHGGAPLAYRVSLSRDGRGFDRGTLVQGTKYEIPLREGRDVLAARVTAVNKTGESIPSQLVVLGKPDGWKSSTRRALVVTGTMPQDGSDNIPQQLADIPNASYHNSAITYRVRPLLTSQVPRGLDEAAHFSSAGMAVESCQCPALGEATLKMDRYAMVVWPTGAINPNSPIIPTDWQSALASFVRRGGTMFLSGSQIVTNLANQGAASRKFLGSTLCLKPAPGQPVPAALKSASDRFISTETTVTLTNVAEYYYELDEVDVLVPEGNRAIPVLHFQNAPDRYAAVLSKPTGASGELIVLSVPLGSIARYEDRSTIVDAVVKQLLGRQ